MSAEQSQRKDLKRPSKNVPNILKDMLVRPDNFEPAQKKRKETRNQYTKDTDRHLAYDNPDIPREQTRNRPGSPVDPIENPQESQDAVMEKLLNHPVFFVYNRIGSRGKIVSETSRTPIVDQKYSSIAPMCSDPNMSFGAAHRYKLKIDNMERKQGIVASPLSINVAPITYKGTNATVTLGNSLLWRNKTREPGEDFFTQRVEPCPKNLNPPLAYEFQDLIPDKDYLFGLKLKRKSEETTKNIPRYTTEMYSEYKSGADLMANGLVWNNLKLTSSEEVAMKPPTDGHHRATLFLIYLRHKYNLVLTMYEMDEDQTILDVVEFPETTFFAVSYNKTYEKKRRTGKTSRDSAERSMSCGDRKTETDTHLDSGEDQEELQIVPVINENRNEGIDIAAACPATRTSGTVSDSEQVPEEQRAELENDQNRNEEGDKEEHPILPAIEQRIDVAAAFPANEHLITFVGTHATVTLGYSKLWRKKERQPGQEYFWKRLDGHPKCVFPPLVYQLHNLNAEKTYEFGVKFVRTADESWCSKELFSEQATNLEGKTLSFMKMQMACSEKAATEANAKARANGKPESFMHILPYRYIYVPSLTIYEIVGDTRCVLEVVEFKETMFLASSTSPPFCSKSSNVPQEQEPQTS